LTQRESAFVPDSRSSAFDPLLAHLDLAEPSGLRISTWSPASTVVVMARRGAEGVTAERLLALARYAPDTTVLHTGPGMWLILCDRDRAAIPDLDDVSTGFGQGDGYATLWLHGDAALTVLQKGIFIDLRTALAANDSCVSSVIAHINVTAWRVSSDTFGVAVPRSYAGSFWHWLSTVAAAEGILIGL
jgi:methylglutamate dehydrogenase subunit D